MKLVIVGSTGLSGSKLVTRRRRSRESPWGGH